ncbi:MAG TPA: FecR family protein [Gemmatimonadaceae bacterium]
MRTGPFGRAGDDDDEIDDLIQRAFQDALTQDEMKRLSAWRRKSIGNDQRYRRTAHLLSAMRDGGMITWTPPNVSTLLGSARDAPGDPRAPIGSKWVWGAAAAAVVLTASTGAVLLHPHTERPSAANTGSVGYSTGPSEMATVQLSDGSVVRLAPNSRLAFVPRAASREATLEGRAFFSVAKIPGRPFRVHTRLGEATVLGTRFELATDSSELRLLVVSGRVGLSGAVNQLEVHAGESSGVRNGTVAEPKRLSNAATMGEWVGKFLAFQSTPMREVAREIEETYGIRMVPEDSAVANRTVTGTFVDRDARYVIDAVCLVVNAQCSNRAGEIVMTNP